MKKGPRTNSEKEVLRKNVFSRPTFLDSMPTRGDKARAISMLAEQLKAMSSSECVAYKVPDFVEKFKADKYPLSKEMQYVRNQLKSAYGVKHPRVVNHEETIYFWAGFNGKVKNAGS